MVDYLKLQICANCNKLETCKASRTMKDYAHPVPCVFYDGPETADEVFEPMKNVNPNINPIMFKLKSKEHFEYPIIDSHKLPTLNTMGIDGIYLKFENFEDTNRMGDGYYGGDLSKATISFSPSYTDHYPLIRKICSEIRERKSDDLDLDGIFQFFGKQIINGKQIFVTHITFRTNTSGTSGPDQAISVGGWASNSTSDYVYLYPYDKEVKSVRYWNKLIQYFCEKELIKGPLRYNIVNNSPRYRPELELVALKTIRKYQL
jgi:hypothetical protein